MPNILTLCVQPQGCTPADTVLSLNLEGRTVAIFNSGRTLIVQLKNEFQPNREALLRFLDPQENLAWGKSYPGLDWYELTSDERATPKVVAGYLLNEAEGVTEILNSSGTLLAKVKEKSLLGASPSGIYFYSYPAWVIHNPLNVYDSLGNLLWSRSTWPGFWEVAPLSDSLILYWEPKHLLILGANDGKVKAEIPGDVYRDLGSFHARFATSKDGKFFVLFGNTAALSFNQNGALLWSTTFDWNKEFVDDAALSPDGRLLGLMRVRKDQKTRRELEFIDNFARGKQLSSFNFDVGRGAVTGPKSSISISDKLATLLLPSSFDFYSTKGISLDTKTKFFLFDSEKGAVIDTLTANGLVGVSSSKMQDDQFFQLVHDQVRLLLRRKVGVKK